jgi:chromatin segregation and condensation protein Rec8/ScpA/Scc1 (kleisin family)
MGKFKVKPGEPIMPEQFEDPEATKVDDETISDPTAQERIDRVAERLAKKPALTEQKYDQDHSIISH